ncbi:hypothetical protein TWF225_004907 [Orbilia oligospora]|uniref:Uncharacterized protein n=1 Tax=Orbilia oligospora TaxID=2813651 RepID=A0A7C8PXH0_ORBOL|nr:hypothetical protein TWF751_006079 [Orbilia oligospora]KAF3185929.1 hypothetical protein TWF225_004907 [Orbilia oligospora]KAF3263131.1 hypothetical protein TWF128_002083 [Orbilia oligospora]KAF3267497.1 hypothetical protein TWF217_000545 [Orbilia oligospora]KAF3294517.1 hypothetical protein TWF132_003485 [Orbilia oligospora]
MVWLREGYISHSIGIIRRERRFPLYDRTSATTDHPVVDSMGQIDVKAEISFSLLQAIFKGLFIHPRLMMFEKVQVPEQACLTARENFENHGKTTDMCILEASKRARFLRSFCPKLLNFGLVLRARASQRQSMNY